MSVSLPAGRYGDTTKSLLVLLAIAPAFFVRFFQYGDLLMAAGAAAAAIGVLSLLSPSLSDLSTKAFWTALLFFLIVIICQSQPAFAAAAWGTWLLRKAPIYPPPSGRTVIAQTASCFILASILIAWTSAGSLTLWQSLVFAAILAAVAALMNDRLRSDVTGPIPELLSVTVLACIYGFNPIYMLYGQPVLLSAGLASICAFLLYKVSLIGKTAAPAFAIYGTIVYFAFDTFGYAFFIMFLIVCETGDKINKRSENVRLMNNPGQFPARALPAILLAAVATGWEDPFVFYLSFAGSLSAAAFMQWFPGTLEKESTGITALKNFATGSVGASLMALIASLFNFIPTEAIHIVFFAGITPLLTAPLSKALAMPERDGKYIPALFGAAAAAFLHKILL